MRKFKANREHKPLSPSEEQIKKHKDFSRIHHEYEKLMKRGKKPLYKDPKLFLFLFVVAIILLLILLDEI